MAPVKRRKKANEVVPILEVAKTQIHNTFGQILTDCQNSSQHSELLKKFKELYYCVRENPQAALAHQKLCSTTIWKFMFAIFASQKGDCKDNGMAFFIKIVTTVGLEEDVKDSGFPLVLPPFFVFILKCIDQCHNDGRIPIRCHVMEVVKIILENFFNNSYFLGHRSLKSKTYEFLCRRIRDKHHSVRIQSLLCLRFYEENPVVRRAITFSAMKDVNAEVRLTALKILGSIPAIRASVFYTQAFDSSELVRQEAFKRLSQIPLQKISKIEDRRKLISWGLSQSKTVRSIVEKKLLPAWLAYSNHSLINLITKLELTTKAHIVTLMLDTLYKENDEETLGQVDLSFLSEKKLIPVEDLTVEKVQYWLMLCLKFQTCLKILLPDALDLCNYIREVVDAIHKECRAAQAANRPEEYTLFLCLALIFRVSDFVTLEEGARREMRKVVKNVLLDPILEDCIIVNSCMDVTFKVIPKEDFEDFMSEVFASVFREAYTRLDLDLEDPLNQSTKNLSINEHEGRGAGITGNLPGPENNRSDNSKENGVDITYLSPAANETTSSRRIAFKPIFVTSTPTVSTFVQETVYGMEDIRRKKASVTLTRLRTEALIDAAEAKELQNPGENKIDLRRLMERLKKIKAEEAVLIAEFDKARHAEEVGFITAHGTAAPVQRYASPEREEPIVGGISPRLTPDCLPSATPEQQSLDGEFDKDGNRNCMLKGLAILLRYLIWHREVSPTLQHLFDFSIVPCLEDEDSRIRAKVMNIMGVIAILKPEHARTSMLLMYQVVVYDDDKIAKSAAFRTMVDLMIEYDPSVFTPTEHLRDDCFRGLPFAEPLDNHDSTREELRDAFTSIVMSYGGEKPSANELTLRVHGVIKLFLRGRITNLDVLADIIRLWMNPCYAISTVCYQIGSFLPLYASLTLENSNRVAKAFLISMRRAFEERDASGESLNNDVECQGLVDLVLSCLSLDNLAKYSNYQVVHEEFGLEILREIKVDVTKKGNVQLARILPSLKIETKKSALTIYNMCATVFEAMIPALAVTGISGLKTAMKAMLEKLENDFDLDAPDEPEEGMEVEADERIPDTFDSSTIPIGHYLRRSDSTAFESSKTSVNTNLSCQSWT